MAEIEQTRTMDEQTEPERKVETTEETTRRETTETERPAEGSDSTDDAASK